MKKAAYLISIILMVLAGCRAPAPQTQQTVEPQTAAEPQPQEQTAPVTEPRPEVPGTLMTADTFAQVAGPKWTLQSMTVNGNAVELRPPLPTLEIKADQTFTGQSFINRYFGSFRLTPDGRLQWPAPIGSTRMAGDFSLLKLEIDYLKALPQTGQMNLDGSRLLLTSPDGKTQFVYTPAE